MSTKLTLNREKKENDDDEIEEIKTEISFPEIPNSLITLKQLTTSLRVPRNIVASDIQIKNVWQTLPKLLQNIPSELRTNELARLCIAVASGLFDSAINYIWNAVITELREKVKKFGINIIPQVSADTKLDEVELLYLQDSKLLDLCLQLNLITEEGFIKLNQCRETRNNFSAAHPNHGNIDDFELNNFINRCIKYVLMDNSSAIGVDVKMFIAALKNNSFNQEQLNQWVNIIDKTNELQRVFLFSTLQGMYCDSKINEETRINCLNILKSFVPKFSSKAKSELLNQHSDYAIKSDTKKIIASEQLFENLGLLDLLDDVQRHSIISRACQTLRNIHNTMNNFYNEPAFAARLLELTQGIEIPESVKEEFVETVILCGIGDGYGVSNAAQPYIIKMIKYFTKKEVQLFFQLERKKGIIFDRLKKSSCFSFFIKLAKNIDVTTVSTQYIDRYKEFMNTEI